MPPTFEISIDIYLFLLFLLVAAAAGFLLRSRQLAKKNRVIAELEKEMMEAHAEVLDTQRDYCELESKVRDVNSPVIAMKNSKKEETAPKNTAHPGRIRKDRATGSD